MRSRSLIIALSLFLGAALIGCNKSQPTTATPSPNPSGTSGGNPPENTTPIGGGIQPETTAPITGGNPDAPTQPKKPFDNTVQGLVANMPADKQPMAGPDGVIGANESTEWLGENAVGKTIEFSLHVIDVQMQESFTMAGKREVLITVAGESGSRPKTMLSGVNGGTVTLGAQKCEVLLCTVASNIMEGEDARRLLGFKGKQVLFRGEVNSAEFVLAKPKDGLRLNVFVVKLVPVRAAGSGQPEVATTGRPMGGANNSGTPEVAAPNPSNPPPAGGILVLPGAAAGTWGQMVEEDDFLPRHRYVATWIDGKAHGEARAYGPQRRPLAVTHYDHGVPHGERIVYYPDGRKLLHCTFNKGKLDGLYTVWFDNGHVLSTAEYKNGLRDGKQILYFPTGKKMLEATNVAGVMQGEKHHYLPDGRKFATTYWMDDKQIDKQVLIEPTQPEFFAIEQTAKRHGLVPKEAWTGYLIDQARKATPSTGANKKTGEWVSLFNGKDLTGWYPSTDPGKKVKWEVRDGLLVGTGTGQWAYLYTDEDDFEDVRFRIEARINADGNSGLFLRMPDVANLDSPGTPKGMEIQIAVNDKVKTGAIALPAYGWLSKKPQPGAEIKKGIPRSGPRGSTNELLHKAGEWFTMEVLIQGSKVVTTVNGKVTCEDALDPNATPLPPRGFLAIQMHPNHAIPTRGRSAADAPRLSTTIEFRKIEVMRLAK